MRKPDINDKSTILLARNAYDWQYGGAEQFIFNLARGLRDEGMRPIVASRVPELRAHCEANKIATFRNLWLKNATQRRWMWAYYLLYAPLVAQYLWVIWRNRVRLLILTSRDDQIFGTIAARIAGVPVVWFDHGDMKDIVAHKMRFLGRSYYWAMRHADRVIMTSKAEREKITLHFGRSRQINFFNINNGAMPGTGVALERPKDCYIVAYVGRLERDKGLFDLVAAAPEVVKAVPQVRFWLAGKGRDANVLKAEVVRLGLDNNFRFIGHLSNVWDVLLAADIFVYPTHHDTAPLAPAEAILAGVPVLASRIGGIPEMIPEDAGLLLPARSPATWAEAIIGLLSDPKELNKLRAAAKAGARNLDFHVVLKERYLPLFRQVMMEKRQ